MLMFEVIFPNPDGVGLKIFRSNSYPFPTSQINCLHPKLKKKKRKIHVNAALELFSLKQGLMRPVGSQTHSVYVAKDSPFLHFLSG